MIDVDMNPTSLDTPDYRIIIDWSMKQDRREK